MIIIDNMQSINHSITDFEFQVKTPILSTNKFNIGKQAKFAEKEATKQAKIAEKEAAKQAKIAEKEAAKQTKIAEKEAAKQAKIAEKEAAKQAKIAEKEAAKQAKIAEKEAEKQAEKEARFAKREAVKQAKIAEKKAIQKRRERVREIKRLYKIQAVQVSRHLRQYRCNEENRIILENYYRRQREMEQQRLREREIRLRQSEERALEMSRQRIENERRAAVGSLIVSADLRRSERTRQNTNRTVSRDLLTLARDWPNVEQPVNVPRERVRRQPLQTLNQGRMTAVNPLQELINKDLNGCNKPLDQLICCETAYKVDECPICFETIGETNNMILRCGHQVCGDCIIHHLQMVGGMKCPVCREQVGVRVKDWNPPAPKRVVNRR
jgi:hypothetical protein